jgi:hypothetical protein
MKRDGHANDALSFTGICIEFPREEERQ